MSDSQAVEPVPAKEVTKASIRKNVWDQLSKNKIVTYPKPFGRIPNFIGAEQASARLSELEAFQSAKSVEVNPDKVLESARTLVLGNEKDLYVPYPGLEKGLMKKLELDDKHDVKAIVSRWGIEFTGKSVEIEDEIHIDLLVLGSVAVSEDGYRIGKGRGYADLEFAMFKEMKAIDDDTVIVTIVHDSQVFNDFPKDIFKPYDVPVDYILTPTRTIKIQHSLPKPQGIFWHELTERRLSARKFLQELKVKHESEGKDTTLREETAEDRRVRRPFYGPRPFRRRQQPRAANEKTNNGEAKKKMPRSAKSKDAKPVADGAPTENNENVAPQKIERKRKKKSNMGYSLRVSNIQRSVRVRDLKNALREKGIKPNNITWKGSRGFCFLHYSKKSQKEVLEGKENGSNNAINNVIELIQELKINPDSEKNLNVKVMEPITRIETMNVTAV